LERKAGERWNDQVGVGAEIGDGVAAVGIGEGGLAVGRDENPADAGRSFHDAPAEDEGSGGGLETDPVGAWPQSDAAGCRVKLVTRIWRRRSDGVSARMKGCGPCAIGIGGKICGKTTDTIGYGDLNPWHS